MERRSVLSEMTAKGQKKLLLEKEGNLQLFKLKVAKVRYGRLTDLDRYGINPIKRDLQVE